MPIQLDSSIKIGSIQQDLWICCQIRIIGKKLKEQNRTIYYITKYAQFLLIIYFVFF
jgi:hypothetical protein